MAFSALTTTEIESGKPVTASLWTKVKNNFDDLVSRVLAIETAEVEQPTGIILPYIGTSAPIGWVLASGRTIGSASSSATERANADTQTLYELLWNSSTNTELPIQDSSGAGTTRGASAAADFASNKRMPLPDLRGRSITGKDNMGGTTASRVTNAVSGITGTTLMTTGGSQSHTLSLSEMAAHDHGGATANETQKYTRVGDVAGGANGGIYSNNVSTGAATADTTTYMNAHNHTISSAGGGGAHNNMQPTLITNMIVKL